MPPVHLLTKHKCDTDEPCKVLACGEGEDADAAGDEGDVGHDEGAHPGKIHQPAKDHAAHSVRYAWERMSLQAIPSLHFNDI